MPDEREVVAARIRQRLEDVRVKEELIKTFLHYYFDLQDIVVVATVESGGIRPENLANEVYSCFHHVVRGLCEENGDVHKELESARCSHLKRATLDSYKIAINSFLEDETRMREVLDYLVLVEDFNKYIPDGLNKINEIKADTRYIKDQYKDAKSAEAEGDFNRAIDSFNNALERCYGLKDRIELFTRDKTYLLACAREAKQKCEKRKDRGWTLFTAIVAAIVAASLTYCLPKIFASRATERPKEIVDKSAADSSKALYDSFSSTGATHRGTTSALIPTTNEQ